MGGSTSLRLSSVYSKWLTMTVADMARVVNTTSYSRS